ncbi:hypothetical protein H2200_010326 [Cladophialophora chaetospira]|uniref:Xylanolytic transcriptional activator regulatory domain-containing protein n=1 Tax=Cladophialophora chaetospira TaxID=386627 RepID=A0AA38X1E8_9EURO|nr:hypothetical protein H2200_010326 [Cladophialophora chaetospira]
MLEQQLKSIASGIHEKDGTIAAEAEVNLKSASASPPSNISSAAVVPITPNDPIQLPSQSMFVGIMDNFFKYCHNQPYSYFQERTFRRQHSDRKHPVYLLYAFAATAIRFSPQLFTGSDRHKLVQPYCDIAWTQLTQYAFHPTSELDITLVQTSSLLSVIDFIHGQHELAWIKIGLAIRFAQALHLHEEPDFSIPDHEQEARRRTFWSIYLLDKLISISSHRPTMLTDVDCTAVSLKNLKVDPSTARVLVSPSVLARRNLAFDDQLLRELLEFAHVIKAPVIVKPIQENATLECRSTLSQSSHLVSERSNFDPLDHSATPNPRAETANMTSNFNCRDLLGEDIGDIWDDVMHANGVADVMTDRIFS